VEVEVEVQCKNLVVQLKAGREFKGGGYAPVRSLELALTPNCRVNHYELPSYSDLDLIGGGPYVLVAAAGEGAYMEKIGNMLRDDPGYSCFIRGKCEARDLQLAQSNFVFSPGGVFYVLEYIL